MGDTSSVYYHSDLPQSQNSIPRLGTPGTPDFFASLLDFIRTTAPDLPLDPVIFQAISLCVMAGNKHVLLRPREEDIAVVQNLAALVFANIFGYATHKHRISASSGSIPPSSFVPSIFSSPYQGAPTSKMDSSSRRAKRSQSHPIPDDHRRHGRQASELDVSSSGSQRERANTRSGFPFRAPFHAPGTRFGPSGPTDPESSRALHRSSSTSLLPTAVVVTGLEHASVPCHRALLRTLLENRVTFDGNPGSANYASWDLPEDFVLVWVCPFDPRERPSVHKSLLDKFSLSVPVALHPSTRQAYTAYLASQSPGTRSPSQPSTPAQQPTAPILPRDLLPRLRSLSTPAHVNIHASLRLYIADLIGAARHHHELDGTLLGARCVQDAEALVRAHRVLGAGDVGSALVERAAALPATSAAGSPGSLHASMHLQWAGIVPSARSLSSRSDASGAEADWLHVDPREKWDVSEVDAAKVVPRVISHRLRVRDGPEDEMMAGVVYLATAPRVPAGVESNEGVWRRRTVKEILVKLIGDV
ncbi:hypothetical protein EDB84DRAFT_1459703 [Lactarius hengduanensis]|nr:hypothetical protein EDB84DRAFT_1459703 [Lactarius hengduanensis]